MNQMNAGEQVDGLTLLHAADVAKLRLILPFLAGTGARLEPVLLTDGAGAALRRRSTRTGGVSVAITTAPV